MTCVRCGAELNQREGAGRPRRFCGNACKRSVEFELRRFERRLVNLDATVDMWVRRARGQEWWHNGQADAERKMKLAIEHRDEVARDRDRLLKQVEGERDG